MGQRSLEAIKHTLFDRLKQASGKKVAYNHKIETHIGKGPQNFTAFLNVLNNLPLYRADGLFLAPGVLSHTAKVEDLLTVILTNYRLRGWSFTSP